MALSWPWPPGPQLLCVHNGEEEVSIEGPTGQGGPVNRLYLGDTFRSFHERMWVSTKSDLEPASLLDLQGGSFPPWACALEMLTDKRSLTRGDHIPREHLAASGDTPDCHNWGAEGAIGIWQRGQGRC